MSFDVVLPFLRPVEHLILDHDISEIMINGSGKIFIERCGILEHVPGVTVEESTLRIAVKNIARLLGDDISDEQPLLDSACRTVPGSPPYSRRVPLEGRR